MEIRLIIALILPVLSLSGCGDFQHVPQARSAAYYSATGSGTNTSATGQQILTIARSLLGTPYKYGGTTPAGFDCSGFTSYVFQNAGIILPRSAAAQHQISRPVNASALSVGDLLFFRIDKKKISHVAIYAGDNKFIHAPSSGKKVSFGSLDNPYWQAHWIGNGRVF